MIEEVSLPKGWYVGLSSPGQVVSGDELRLRDLQVTPMEFPTRLQEVAPIDFSRYAAAVGAYMALDLDDDGVVDPDFLRIFEKTDPHRYAFRRAKRLQMLGSLTLVDGNHDKKVTIKEFTQYFSGKTGIKKNFEICKGKGGGSGDAEGSVNSNHQDPVSNSSWEEHTIEKVDQFLIVVLVASFIVMQLCMYSSKRRKDDKTPVKAATTKQSKSAKKDKKKEDNKKGSEKTVSDAKADAALREQQKREQRERDLAKKREAMAAKEIEDNLKREEKAKQKKLQEERQKKQAEERKKQLAEEAARKAQAEKDAAEEKAREDAARLLRDKKKKEDRERKKQAAEQQRLAEETAAALIAEQQRLEVHLSLSLCRSCPLDPHVLCPRRASGSNERDRTAKSVWPRTRMHGRNSPRSRIPGRRTATTSKSRSPGPPATPATSPAAPTRRARTSVCGRGASTTRIRAEARNPRSPPWARAHAGRPWFLAR